MLSKQNNAFRLIQHKRYVPLQILHEVYQFLAYTQVGQTGMMSSRMHARLRHGLCAGGQVTMPTVDRSNPLALTQSFGLVALVQRCQQSERDWQAAGEIQQRADLGAIHQANLEALWEALADALRKQARAWVRSGMGLDIESMAMGMFAQIVFVLPGLRLNPDLDLRSYLLKIARNRSIDEYRQVYQDRTRSQMRELGKDAAPLSGATDAYDLADPTSYQAEEHIITGLDNQACLRAIRRFWTTLGALDRQIMELRWYAEPPRTFRAVADQLGPGWTEEAVRQRHYRIMRETRAYLKSQGLI